MFIRPITLLLILGFCFSGTRPLRAQSVIYGVLQDETGKLLQSASVHLLKAGDSSLVKGIMSDASGRYSFSDITSGQYYISSTFTGMSEVYSDIIEVNELNKEINVGILVLTS